MKAPALLTVPPPAPPPAEAPTRRLRDAILARMFAGQAAKEIAHELGVSACAVYDHITSAGYALRYVNADEMALVNQHRRAQPRPRTSAPAP